MQDHHLVRRLMSLASDQLRRPAIRSSGGALDLGALRTGMLQVAGWLAGAGLQRGDRVAVCLPKSAESVQAMYGILAAGGTYVPLHFQGPPARLAAILASVRPRRC